MKLLSKSLHGLLPKQEMEDGRCDLAIAGYFTDLPEGFYQQDLIKDTFKCVVRRGHPVTAQKLTLKRYLDLKHILISPKGDFDGIVDRILAEKEQKREIIAATSSFMAPGPVLQKTDFILTAPGKLCDHLKEVFQLDVLTPPLNMPTINVVQVWHNKVHKDPPLQWLRAKIHQLCLQQKLK